MVHGGIDGFSRLVVFLKCATNNRAETVMSTFMDGTRRYGIPSRVRSDHGGENADVGRFMESIRGRDRGSHIQGSSVHNQRIERLHRDTTRCCLSSFYTVFDHMDNEGILDLSNDTVNKTVTVLEAKCDTIHLASKKSFVFLLCRLIYFSVSYFTAIFFLNPYIFGRI